jgi:hypothetical protein
MNFNTKIIKIGLVEVESTLWRFKCHDRWLMTSYSKHPQRRFCQIQFKIQPYTQGFHFRYPPKPAAAKTLTQAGHVALRFWVPHGSLSLGWGRTGDIYYQYKNRDAYRFWYTCTVYYQFVMDLRRLTDTFEKWITLVYTKFKTWDNLQRYELWKALHILCRIIWEFCIWSKTVHRLTSIYSVMLAMLCSILCFRLLIEQM